MSDIAKKPVPKWLAIVIIVIAVSIIGGIMNKLTGGTSTSSTAPATAPAVTPVAEEPVEKPAVMVPDYEIVQTEDLTFGSTIRFQYRVRVAGQPTEDNLRAVVDDVVAKAKQGPAFNAISVGLYGEADDVLSAYTLGYAELAPGGNWSAADTVKAGDYASMKLVVDIY